MHTNAGLRFLRTLARKGERVPSYLLPATDEPRGGQHLHTAPPGSRPAATAAHDRTLPR